jgi:alanine dehydrogenase
LANASLPYISALADKGVDEALRDDPGLAAGVYLYKGKMVHQMAGETLGIPVTPLEQLL